ncbi:uncharacterized protein FOMMEDRAFT_170690 [Fomitiporia mediterranea MF3/22]|uniref:uncharacterized protein n=1 Tax=Fomitiporia mediterranea (strain MF3/22) TaxID=694068 RepID=UPI000440994C|nr:uncharacterized protein FOMMEDRAFT_170690 [Fomitiporia mediterranea MF3/22]EJC98864.1 hypothetical protein FOMMEDRAFT_170690 [Fomitiporia mediterranea MF3/22]
MPRRRTSRPKSAASNSRRKSSIRRWENREDIPLDEIDEFHEQRDKILLEGEEAAPDSDYDDDEVFALKGLAESSDEEMDEEDEEDEEDEAEEVSKPQKKAKAKQTKKSEKKSGKKVTSSDEDKSEDEEEEEESWGTKKSAYYSSNAAQIESDDEEAHEMEEQEARRIQAKLRASMREEDFGYSEALQSAVDLQPIDDLWKQDEKPLPTPAGTDRASILRHLQKTDPVSLALAFEWEDIACSVMKIEQQIAEIPDSTENKALGLIHVHHQTLLTYAALLAFYVHLRSSEKYAARPDLLRQHPILKRLLTLKQSLITFEELGFIASDSEDDLDSEEIDELDLDLDDDEDHDDGMGMDLDGRAMLDTWVTTRKRGLDVGELEQLLSEANASAKTKKPLNPDNETKVTESLPPKKKQKRSDGKAVPTKVTFDVEEPTLPSKSKAKKTSTSLSSLGLDDHASSSSAKSSGFDFGFGEATSLDEADKQDKSTRRKALRFHTSKIEASSLRRQNARTALGGDDDVPYRERKKAREEKEKEAARKRRASLGTGGDDLDLNDGDPPPEEYGRKGEEEKSGSGDDAEEDEEDGYYSLVKRQKSAKKAEKKAQYEAAKETTRINFSDENTSTNQQRAITRAILTNKGLTPHRLNKNKAARNPRVKKRQKFEKAKKKLASQKAIYKGGVEGGGGRGGRYDGETSGISKVVKSVKL